MTEDVPGTKIAERLLSRPEGATMSELIAATGGPQYNVLKRLEAKGYKVHKVKEGRGTRYSASPPRPEYELTISRKGQVVLPKQLRDKARLRPGGKVRATLDDGKIIISPKPYGIDDLFGILHRPGMRPRTLKEIDEGIIAGAVESGLGGLRSRKR